MKSFISEGKTVLDAISNALIIADYPINFSIKIVEKEERSIFWWHNKKAIIVFSYIPKEMQKNNVQKNYKKNYNKENALYNNKSDHNYDAPEYTSSIKVNKIDTDIIDDNQQKKNFREKKEDNIENRYRKNTHENNNFKKRDEDFLFDDQYKKNKLKKNNQQLKKNCALQSDLGFALNGKKIHEERTEDFSSFVKNVDNNYPLKEWKIEYIEFIERWILQLNDSLSFTNEKLIVTVKDNILFIKIVEFKPKNNIVKKHFYSSIVILLYEILQSTFKEFSIKDYKIIIE